MADMYGGRELRFSSPATIFKLQNDRWIDQAGGNLSLFTQCDHQATQIRFEITPESDPPRFYQLIFSMGKAMKKKNKKAWVLKAQELDSLDADAPEISAESEQILALRFPMENQSEAFRQHVENALKKMSRRPSINPAEAYRKASQQKWQCPMCTYDNEGTMTCVMCRTSRTTIGRKSVASVVEGEGEGAYEGEGLPFGSPPVSSVPSFTQTESQAIFGGRASHGSRIEDDFALDDIDSAPGPQIDHPPRMGGLARHKSAPGPARRQESQPELTEDQQMMLGSILSLEYGFSTDKIIAAVRVAKTADRAVHYLFHPDQMPAPPPPEREKAGSCIGGLVSSGQWTCSSCTFINEATDATCTICATGKNPNPQPPQVNNLDNPRKFSTLPDMSLSAQRMQDTRYQATKGDFETAAHLISSGVNVSSDTFNVLRIVTRKLLKKDIKYRTLDTTLPKVQGMLGFEGVLEFLQKLGFRADESMTKLCMEPDQPPEKMVHAALSVIEDKIQIFEHRKQNREVLRNIARDGHQLRKPELIAGKETNHGGAANAEADADPDEFTLNQLVTFITLEDYRDEEAHKVIILCHKTFTTSIQLLTCLRTRFFLHRQVKGDDDTRIAKRGLKVGKVLKFWLENYWIEDFQDDPTCSEFLEGIIHEMQAEPRRHATRLGNDLENMISELRREAGNRRNSVVSLENIQIPASFQLKDQPAETLADQLSLMDQELFFRIKPRECLNQNWKKKNNKTLAPNIMKMIDQFNHVTSIF